MTFNKNVWTKETLQVPSGWKGLENYIESVISTFNIDKNVALEFGVDTGYSLKILSQIFNSSIGVDTFTGDAHIGHSQGDEFYQDILKKFKDSNTKIVRANYKDYIKVNDNNYDLIHIDIVHHYKETFECADWSVQHSKVVLIHDTSTFPEMARVCRDISNIHKLEYHNIPEHNGLGILYRR